MRILRALIFLWGALGFTLLALAIGFGLAALDQADAKYLSLVWIFGILASVLGLGTVAAFIAAWSKAGYMPSEGQNRLEAEKYRQSVKEITQLREVLLDNERAFKSLARSYINDQENRGEEAQESLSALDR